MKQEVIAASVDLWSNILSQPPSSNVNDIWKDHLRICETLDLIEEHQIKYHFDEDRLSKLNDFQNWADKLGIKYDGVAVKETEMGLSLVAKEDFPSDAIVVKVPRNAIFYILGTDQVVRSVDHVGLALILANEMLKPASKWKEYLSILPPSYSTPLFFSKEQLQQMKPSPAFEESVLMFRTVARHFIYFFMRLVSEKNLSKNKRKILQNAPFARTSLNLQNFTFDLYKWCVSTVSTRINMIPSLIMDGENELQTRMVPSLIPFMDLANHARKSTNPGSVYFDVETDSVDLQLKSSVDSGTEIFIYYGARTNRKFFVHNGFVPEEVNPDDFYELRLGLPKNENSFWKFEWLEKKEIVLDRNFYIFRLYQQEIEQGTLESPGLSRLLEFSKTFVAQNVEDLSQAENNEKSTKFLTDRIRLLLLGYKDLPSQEGQEDDLISKFIWRLKNSEKKILEGLLEILSHK
uniref:protein-histidine N-methyltransferase n=2 Tax=Acrobeloides nanus TaxID=290746 RepID=A0A914BUN5_9BILA